MLALTLIPLSARAGTTFPFDDARYLQQGEKDGGLVHRTDEKASGALPLLVYLHGTNEKGPLHRGLGAPGFDVRSIVGSLNLPAMLVAGPSTTRDAWTGSRVWADFDLTRFVDAAEAALPSEVSVDRARVILAGHSGAGCNLKGGLLSGAGLAPYALLAIDVCMDADFGRAFAAASERSPVYVFWQESWPRDVAAFEAELTGRGNIEKVDVPGPTAHEDIVGIALSRALPRLLPKGG